MSVASNNINAQMSPLKTGSKVADVEKVAGLTLYLP